MKHTLRLTKSKAHTPIHIIQVDGAKVVEFRLYFRAGFAYFSKTDHHVPHMLEHLLFGQNPESPEVRTLAHTLQRLGAVANASTDNDHITIMLRAPLATAVEALESILASVTKPVFSEEAIESERQIVLRELYERYDGLGAVVGAELIGKLLAPNAPTSPDEEAADIQAIDGQNIRSAFTEFIVSSNLVMVASGDIAPKTEQKLVDLVSHFFPKKPKPQRPRNAFEPLKEPLLITIPHGDPNNASFVMAVVLDALEARDRVARNLVMNMLFATTDAVIPATLRRLGYVYSIDVDQVDYEHKIIFFLTLTASSEKLPYAIAEVHALLKRYSKAPFPADEFESIALYAQHMLPTVNETPADLINWYQSSFLYGEAKTTVEDEMKTIKSFTEADVANVIKRDLVQKDWNWGIICPGSETWAALLFEKLTSSPARKLAYVKYRDAAFAEIKRIPALRSVAKREFWDSLAQLGFYILFFATLLTLLFVANFPNPLGQGTISLFDYAAKSGRIWLGALVIVPLCLISLLSYMASKKYIQEINLALAAIATPAYWFAVIGIFGDIGADKQSFWEHVASIIQPLFFGVVVPCAIITSIALAKATRRLERS